MVGASKSKAADWLSRNFSCFLPVIICVYLVVGLVLFVVLQGDLNSWVSFMGSTDAMALMAVYFVAGAAGVGVVWFLKRDPDLLASPRRILVACFLAALIIGVCVFTYLNVNAAQADYAWMNDGFTYQQMGQSFLVNHDFMNNGTLTHHFGPVFPLYLSVFYAVLPVHLGTQLADELLFLLSVLAVFLVTRRMYGSVSGLVTAALVATVPIFVFGAARNYSEPLVLIFYTLTVYFLLESLKPGKQNRIIVAAVTAALGVLTKSSFGVFLVITVGGVLIWRFRYMRWKMFTNKNYVLAVLVFVGLDGVWMWRNVADFWHGGFWNLLAAAQPSVYIDQAQSYVFAHDVGGFLVQSLFFAAFTVVFLWAFVWFFWDYLRRAWRRIGEERLSGLLTVIAVTVVTGILATALLFVYENSWMPDYWISYWPVSQVRYMVYQLVRYCFIALVPLSWLAYEGAKKE